MRYKAKKKGDEDKISQSLQKLLMEDLTLNSVNDLSLIHILHTYYDTKIQIWTKEVVDAVVEIVRRTDSEEGVYNYGAVFIGMTCLLYTSRKSTI